MTDDPTLSYSDQRSAYWTAVVVLTLSSVAAAALTLVLVRFSAGSELYFVLAPLGISLLIALLSVWSSKVLIDEAQRRAVEQMEIAKLESELEMSQRTRELHHDLVNHLSAVSSWIQLGAGDRAVRYINQILNTLHPSKVVTVSQDPNGLTLLLGMMGQKLAQAEEKGIALLVQLDSEWAQAGIDDEVAIRVLGNLIDNALEAAAECEAPESSRVEITVAIEEQTALFRVWNNGPPVPLDVLKRLGESSERPDVRQPRGLGLYIVRKLVREANGTMTLDSSAEEGTEIKIRFPCTHAHAAKM